MKNLNLEFPDNPEPRCACLLLLDTSGSMAGRPIDELNNGLRTFRDCLAKDPLASLRVEVAIVTFDNAPRVVQDFITADEFEPPTLTAPGAATNVGAAVEMALDLVQGRKAVYRTNGIAYYQPWVFMITDGEPTDSKDAVQRAANRLREDEKNRRLSFFAVGVQGANMAALKTISVREPLKLDGLNFKEMFIWLSASLQRVSKSKTNKDGAGEQVSLAPVGWGTVGG